MSLFESHSGANLVTINGKTQRITTAPIGEPVETLVKQPSGKIVAEYKQWYKCTCVCSARYKYVGMTADAASACAEAMRSKWTRAKKIWKCVLTTDDENDDVVYSYKWIEGDDDGTVLESDITIEYVGGRMYQVVVNAETQDEKYTYTPSSITFAYPPCFNGVS